MSLFIALAILLALLLVALIFQLPLYGALLLGSLPFIAIALRRGSSLSDVKAALWQGFIKPLKVYQIMLLIGLSKPLWVACGATDYLIDLGNQLIGPHSFLFVAFTFTFFMTVLLGSAIGTTGLVGVTFMSMASSGGVNLAMTAGAIVSAIYLGERASPLSSCANLVSEISGVPLFKYIQANLLSRWKSLALILIAYGLLSYLNPLVLGAGAEKTDLISPDSHSALSVLPFVLMVAGILIKRDIITALMLSAFTGFFMAYFFNGIPLGTLIKALLGESGLLGMFRASLVLMSAALLTGLFEGTSLLEEFAEKLRIFLKYDRFKLIFVSSLIGSLIGCSQTFAVLFARQMAGPLYQNSDEDQRQLSCDLADTAVLVPAWVPWNVAFSIPATLLTADYTLLFWAFSVTWIPLTAYVLNAFTLKKVKGHSPY